MRYWTRTAVTPRRIAKVISERVLSMVNNLRTDKIQVLGGCKQHKPQLIVHETRIVIARLADFGCVCVCVCVFVCVLHAKFGKGLSCGYFEVLH